MGEGPEPPFPWFEWLSVDPANVSLVHVRQQCNWLQAIEGVLDSAHTNALHSDVVRVDPEGTGPDGASRRNGAAFSRPSADTRPRLRAVDTPYGFRYGAIRTTIKEPDKYKYVRTSVFIAPFFMMLSSSAGIGDVQAYVPIDDEHVAFYYAHYSLDGPLDDEEWRAWIGCRRGVDLDEQYRPIRTRENQWLQDREAMARGESYSGVSGVLNQDFAVQESMGPVYDRSKEHLGTTDLAVLHLRQLLLKSLDKVARGEPPIGLDGQPFRYDKIRPEDRVIPIDDPWETVGAASDGVGAS
jgi:phthalate 4,5-dioxygenase oxygenase subunit